MALPDLVEQRARGHRQHLLRPGGDHGEEAGCSCARVLEVVGQVGVEGHGVALAPGRGRRRRRRAAASPSSTSAVSRLPGSCIGGSPGPPVAAAGARVWKATSARWPGNGGRHDLVAVAAAPGSAAKRARRRARRSRRRPRPGAGAGTASAPGPTAIRPATDSVGLVSPRSTWLSICADTPLRSARSRSERSIASRSARTRGPIWRLLGWESRSPGAYVITDDCRGVLMGIGAECLEPRIPHLSRR